MAGKSSIKTAYSKTVSYDKGKYRLKVLYKVSKNALLFKPFIEIPDGFDHSHNVKVTWTRLITSISKNGIVSKKSSKYIVKKSSISKNTTKPKNNPMKFVKNWQSNGDDDIIITAHIGGSAVAIRIDCDKRPEAPRFAAGSPSFDKNVGFLFKGVYKSSFKRPVKGIIVQRFEDHAQATWTTVANVENTYGFYGDINGGKFEFKAMKAYQSSEDHKRYKFRIGSYNDETPPKDKDKKSTWSTTSDWYYTTPPPVTDLNLRRESDQVNVITFKRTADQIRRRLICGYKISVSNDHGITWQEIDYRDLDTKCSKLIPSEPDNYDWMDPAIENVTIKHYNCEIDKSYMYKIQTWNWKNDKAREQFKPPGQTIYEQTPKDDLITYKYKNYDTSDTKVGESFNTPAPPRYVKVSITSEGNVRLKIGLNKNTTARQVGIATSTDYKPVNVKPVDISYMYAFDEIPKKVPQHMPIPGLELEDLFTPYGVGWLIDKTGKTASVDPNKLYLVVGAFNYREGYKPRKSNKNHPTIPWTFGEIYRWSEEDFKFIKYTPEADPVTDDHWTTLKMLTLSEIDIKDGDDGLDEIQYIDREADTSTTEEGNLSKEIYYKIWCINPDIHNPPKLKDGRSTDLISSSVQALTKPAKPTLLEPPDKMVIMHTQTDVEFSWLHNPLDTTKQKAYKFEYRKETSPTWIAIEKESNISVHKIDINGNFNPGDTIVWRVCTKGEHKDFSEPSTERSFKVLSPPFFNWFEPSDGAIINQLPLDIKGAYHDESGKIKSVSLEIFKDGVLQKKYTDSEITYTPTNHFILQFKIKYLFDDDSKYNIRLTFYSTSGLSCTIGRDIAIKYSENIDLSKGFVLGHEFDEDLGVAVLSLNRKNANSTVTEGTESTEPDPSITVVDDEIERVYIYRISDNEKTLVDTVDVIEYIRDENGTPTENYRVLIDESAKLFDVYAPTNRSVKYQLIEQTVKGMLNIGEIQECVFDTNWSYVLWGDGNVIRTKWNPKGDVKISRPERQSVRYSGRRFPVVYDSNAEEETYSYKTTLYGLDENEFSSDPSEDEFLRDGRSTLDQLRYMIRNGGMGIWKSVGGDCYNAIFEFNYNESYKNGVRQWDCSLNATRTDTIPKYIPIEKSDPPTVGGNQNG